MILRYYFYLQSFIYKHIKVDSIMFQNPVVWTESCSVTTLAPGLFKGVELAFSF